jgi:hypothetical protein
MLWTWKAFVNQHCLLNLISPTGEETNGIHYRPKFHRNKSKQKFSFTMETHRKITCWLIEKLHAIEFRWQMAHANRCYVLVTPYITELPHTSSDHTRCHTGCSNWRQTPHMIDNMFENSSFVAVKLNISNGTEPLSAAIGEFLHDKWIANLYETSWFSLACRGNLDPCTFFELGL